jgi:hypothetical protein
MFWMVHATVGIRAQIGQPAWAEELIGCIEVCRAALVDMEALCDNC